MRRSIKIDESSQFPCGTALVRIVPPMTVLLNNGQPKSIDEPGLQSSGYAEIWEGEGWCCLVGLRSRFIIVIRPETGLLLSVGPLERLDLGAGYDPGGLEHIDFVEIDDADVLVVHEIGVARVASDGTLKWQRTHDDLTARHRGIQDKAIWFEGEYERFGFDITGGDPRFRATL